MLTKATKALENFFGVFVIIGFIVFSIGNSTITEMRCGKTFTLAPIDYIVPIVIAAALSFGLVLGLLWVGVFINDIISRFLRTAFSFLRPASPFVSMVFSNCAIIIVFAILCICIHLGFDSYVDKHHGPWDVKYRNMDVIGAPWEGHPGYVWVRTEHEGGFDAFSLMTLNALEMFLCCFTLYCIYAAIAAVTLPPRTGG
jgi:hypothetical protein